MFDVVFDILIIVEECVQYMLLIWKQYFVYVVDIVSELDLEFVVVFFVGWSLIGGLWVNVDDGMKKLVWSEIVLYL